MTLKIGDLIKLGKTTFVLTKSIEEDRGLEFRCESVDNPDHDLYATEVELILMCATQELPQTYKELKAQKNAIKAMGATKGMTIGIDLGVNEKGELYKLPSNETKIENEPGLESGTALEFEGMSYNKIMQSGFDKLLKTWEEELVADVLTMVEQWPMTKDLNIAKVPYMQFGCLPPIWSPRFTTQADAVSILDGLTPIKPAACECGTTSVGGSKHSTWCPIKDVK